MALLKERERERRWEEEEGEEKEEEEEEEERAGDIDQTLTRLFDIFSLSLFLCGGKGNFKAGGK